MVEKPHPKEKKTFASKNPQLISFLTNKLNSVNPLAKPPEIREALSLTKEDLMNAGLTLNVGGTAYDLASAKKFRGTQSYEEFEVYVNLGIRNVCSSALNQLYNEEFARLTSREHSDYPILIWRCPCGKRRYYYYTTFTPEEILAWNKRHTAIANRATDLGKEL